MLHFEGEKDFAQAPSHVAARLGDARFLVRCIPGIEAAKHVEPTLALWTLRPSLGFVRGTLEVTLRIVEATADRVRTQVKSKGIGSTSTVDSVLAVTARDNGTRVHWTGDLVELGGLLKAVPPGLIQGSAQKVIADVWAEVERQMGAPM